LIQQQKNVRGLILSIQYFREQGIEDIVKTAEQTASKMELNLVFPGREKEKQKNGS